MATPSAIRLLFSYEGGRVELVSRQRVATVSPPSDPVEGYEGERGLWVEVRDRGGRTLHRNVLEDFLSGDVEVFAPQPDPSVSRAAVERPSGAFAVLVPDLGDADHVALMASPRATGPERARAAPREVLRVPLNEDGGAAT
jgi:hypothetical protein